MANQSIICYLKQIPILNISLWFQLFSSFCRLEKYSHNHLLQNVYIKYCTFLHCFSKMFSISQRVSVGVQLHFSVEENEKSLNSLSHTTAFTCLFVEPIPHSWHVRSRRWMECSFYILLLQFGIDFNSIPELNGLLNFSRSSYKIYPSVKMYFLWRPSSANKLSSVLING